MIEYIKKHILAVLIGVLGFLSAIVTLFINVNELISIKFLIFIIFVTCVIVSILIGFIVELLKNSYNNDTVNNLKLKNLNRSTEKGDVYLNKSNIDFAYGDVVKIYYLDKDKIERFIGIGIIGHIQKEQNICHINFLLKENPNEKTNEVYFSLKINKDELELLTSRD
ncbi:hypothetical protein ACN5PC_04050 [Aliarcobacter butzleri]|uniref:hypothetical protein n=2 Tax=Aliarcobacter butzleri TaxID=28197 RepID=UPI003AF76C02